jgi:hypothetical protein
LVLQKKKQGKKTEQSFGDNLKTKQQMQPPTSDLHMNTTPHKTPTKLRKFDLEDARDNIPTSGFYRWFAYSTNLRSKITS